MERPALKKLLDDVRASRIDVIVVYKVDRLTRSLADFAKLVELFDDHQASFVSVTQAFKTTASVGGLGGDGDADHSCGPGLTVQTVPPLPSSSPAHDRPRLSEPMVMSPR
jgi:resolvase-like protein